MTLFPLETEGLVTWLEPTLSSTGNLLASDCNSPNSFLSQPNLC